MSDDIFHATPTYLYEQKKSSKGRRVAERGCSTATAAAAAGADEKRTAVATAAASG